MEPFDALIAEFSGRPREAADGVAPGAIEEAEERLGHALPPDLRTMLLRIGHWSALHVHNVLRDPASLEDCDGRTVFMDENQHVVSWGISAGAAESEVWQRNDTDDAWYSEELSLLEFLRSMLEWYREQGVLAFE